MSQLFNERNYRGDPTPQDCGDLDLLNAALIARSLVRVAWPGVRMRE